MSTYKIYNIVFTLAFIACIFAPMRANAANKYASASVLAEGRWVKIKVAESGIHQITQSTLSSWGFNDISKVKIYGYGGAMISESLDNKSIDDLPQVPTFQSDGKILFYAQGPVSWQYASTGLLRYGQQINPYSLYGYYFVTDTDTLEPAALESTGKAESADDKLITTFPERLFHEEDFTAPSTTGRIILGEDFLYTKTRDFDFNLTGIDGNKKAIVKVQFMAMPRSADAYLNISSGENQIGSIRFGKNTDTEYGIGVLGTGSYSIDMDGEDLNLRLAFNGSGVVDLANLDYITINYVRRLEIDRNEFYFRSFTTSCRDSVFSLAGASTKLQIWDITTAHAPKTVAFQESGGSAYFRQTESGKREYVAFDPTASYPSPTSEGAIANQNLHGTETPTMLIITPSAFISEAERLAELHRNTDGMKVQVVTDQAVYNEFSSGTPDAMAYRKISKMWYDRSINEDEYSNEKYRYLLLFGRCVFDNRQVTSNGKSARYPKLLTWESENSTSKSSSFNSDDVFGFLEDGTDVSKINIYKTLNIGIGRIPVKSIDEARIAVDKIYSYASDTDLGDWKSRIMVIADNGDNGIHMNRSNDGVESLEANGADKYNISRVYLDAYDAGSSYTFPEAREQMYRNFRNGVIFASYLGHGNPVSWTHNGLLRWQDIENEFYYKHLPLLYTGTCEFTPWDSPDVSGGEELFLNGQGGAIGLITASRATGMDANGVLLMALGKHMFAPLPNGEMPRIGDVLRNAKNDPIYNKPNGSSGSSGNASHSLKYALIGDPALRLNYPKHQISVTSINGIEVSEDNMPEIQARQEVEIKGKVTDNSGALLTDFTGLLSVSIFDAEMSVSTYGKGDSDSDDAGAVVTYQDHPNRLYVGNDSVKNGEFSIKFRMPTSIVNNYTPAMAIFYAESNGIDALGKNENFYAYGFDTTDNGDTEGPEITLLALNGESFKDGDTVNETPFLLASFRDESGINLSTFDIGHAITLILDNKTTISGLENYYTQDSEKNGRIQYQMDELSEGPHTLKLRVWDVYGNYSEKEISFNVEKGQKPSLFRIYTTSNPAKTSADFYIEHNRPDALLNVTLYVYNLMGQTVWTTTTTGRSDMYTSMPITWDLTDGTGRRVNRGIYLYRATVSTDGGEESSICQRIAVASE